MIEKSLMSLRQQQALASLLFDSENANQLYFHANPAGDWHTQDFIPRKISASKNKLYMNVEKKKPFQSLKMGLQQPFDFREPKNGKPMSPRYKTHLNRSDDHKKNIIRMRNLSIDENN